MTASDAADVDRRRLFAVPVLGLVLYLAFGWRFSVIVWVTGVGLAACVGRDVTRFIAAAKRLNDFS